MSILVVGSLHLDVVLRAPQFPTLDETVPGSSVDYVFGGKGGNQAVAASRFGAEVHFAGRAGSDPFGDTIRAALSAGDVDISQLQRDQGPSGMSAAIVNASGEYGAVIVSAANLNIVADEVMVPGGTSIVLLQNEIPEAVNLAVARKAKSAGAHVWLNAAPARDLSAELMDVIDFLIVNRVEAAFYEGQIFKVETLVTLGPDGVEHNGKHYKGFDVDVASTHGAGDVFVGALAARVAGGSRISEAIEPAQGAAALHVSLPLREREGLSAAMVKAFCVDYANR